MFFETGQPESFPGLLFLLVSVFTEDGLCVETGVSIKCHCASESEGLLAWVVVSFLAIVAERVV